MTGKLLKVASLVALGALAACAQNRVVADVTRFHVQQPVTRGSVFLEPANMANAGTLEFQNYSAAVAAELREAGFNVVDTRQGADIIGEIDYSERTRPGGPERSPVTIGVGGGTFGGHVGAGVGATFGVGEKRGNDININMLGLQLKRAGDGAVIWEGRASAEAPSGSQYGPLSAAIPALADVLMRDFPGPSGQTVTYKF
jgi:hypothetical protein